jgi:hypothetical protein
MKQLIYSVGLIAAISGSAAAGTPPAIQSLLDHEESYYRQDSTTNEWQFNPGATIGDEDSDYGCQVDLNHAAKDGVPDTLTVDVPFDTPDWSKGQHTVAELRSYCARAQRMAAIAGIVSGFKLGVDDDQGDLAAKCIEWYDETVKSFKLDPTAITLPDEGVGSELVDRATGDPWKGTLEEGRKKFCDGNAKEYLEAQAADEAPYRKVLKGGKLKAALEDLLDKEVLGKGGKELSIPQMAKAKIWFHLKWYDEQSCGDGSQIVYAVERYTFTADDYDATQKEYCGVPPKSAYK